jgi:hypothetical protein
MEAVTLMTAAAGYTHFGGVFSTVLPLVVLIAVLVWYVLVARRHP